MFLLLTHVRQLLHASHFCKQHSTLDIWIWRLHALLNVLPFAHSIKSKDKTDSSLINCRSSGLRICTAAGSTAAMLSAGGFPMPITSKDLQYMVREPIKNSSAPTNFHGVIQPNQSMVATWYCKEGVVYIDGSHVLHLLSHGDTMEISSRAPTLKAFLPSHLLKKL